MKQRGSASAWIIVTVAVLVCIGGFLAVRHLTRAPEGETVEERAPVVTVETAPATLKRWERSLEITGTVKAEDRLQIGSEVGGLKVVRVLVEEGDHVVEGQLMAQLNTSLLSARMEQLQARYAQQEAVLAKARQPERPLEIAQLESALRQAEATVQQEQANLSLAQAALDNARTNVQRYDNLYNQGAVAEIESENRQLELQSQEAQVQAARDRIQAAEFAARQARERLALARSGGRAEDITIAQAQLEELAAQMQEVEAQMAQARITAPTSGWVLDRQVALGDVTSPGAVLFEIARGGRFQLSGSVPETQVGQIEAGMPVTVVHDGKQIEAVVDRIAPLVDEQTRNAEVLIDLPNDSGLRPGMFASARIDLGGSEAVTVPLEAVRGESPDYYVYVLEDDKARRKPVRVAERNDGLAVISEGLAPGASVIVQGGGFLRDGDTVAHG